jgi:uncharacterized protein DUF3987/DNA polymerase family A
MSSLFQRLARRYIVPPPTKSGGLRLGFDIEANGLIETATAAHCIVIADLDSDQVYEYGPEQIADALAHLARADYLTGHNIQAYDIPLLQRLYGWASSANTEVLDTLVAGRLILPNLGDIDDQVAAMGGGALGKLRGRYSVEAWGARLGVAKVGVDIKDFSAWTPELQARCVGDVKTTKTLWHFLEPDGYSAQAMELEHRANAICNRIEADGVPFDNAAAEHLEQRWSADCAKMEAALREQFPGMNPSSRLQVAKQLEARGWIPEERTEKTGQAKITDELLETIPQQYPEFASLIDYHILKRRIAQLSKGKKAWRKNVGKDGRLHGGIVHAAQPRQPLRPEPCAGAESETGNTVRDRMPSLVSRAGGMVVRRLRSSDPARPYLRHYLTKFDHGAYANAFLAGVDQHWKGVIILDLVAEGTARNDQNKVHTIAREGAKGFRYGFLFGAQSKRAGQIINKITRSIQHADPANDLHRRFFAGAARPSEDALTRVGRRALDEFEAGTPGLRQLRQALRSHADRHGWLFGLDGRRVPVRALHSTLNFIVTSAEAIICKRWLVQVYDELRARFRYGWDGDVVIALWVHDEIACCCRSEIAAEVGEIMVRHAKAAGEFYGLRVPLDADFKIGRNWANEPIESQTPIIDTAVKSDDDAPVVDKAPPQPVNQIDWAALLERDFPRAATSTSTATEMSATATDATAAETRLTSAATPFIPPPPPMDEPTTHQAHGNGYGGNGYGGNGHRNRRHGSDGNVHGDSGPKRGRCTAQWFYPYIDRSNYLRVDRYDSPNGDRKFYQYHWDGKQWVEGVKGTYAERKIPYRLPELKAALQANPNVEVELCEGESDADAMARLGFIATTNPGGALSWTSELTAWLRILGVRRANIHEDNDGEAHGHKGPKRSALLIAELSDFIKLKIVRYPDVPEGEDVRWWIEHGHTKAELETHIAAAPLISDAPLFDPWAEFNAPEFPLDVLPPVVREFVSTQSTIIGADISAMAMAVLAALSGAIDHRFALKLMQHGNWWAHPRLWVLLVGAPSTMKTPAINAATKPLERYQKQRMKEHQAAVKEHKARGDRSEDAPPPPVRYVAWDSTVEALGDILSRSPRGILVKRDEVAGWIGSMERYHNGRVSSDRAFWLQAYNGGPYITDRIKRGEVAIENNSVSFLSGTQPSRLAEMHGLTSDGLLQRLLPVLMKPGKPPQDAPADDTAYDALTCKLIETEPTHLHMTEVALARMERLRNYLHKYANACDSLADGLQAFMIKLTEVAGSLALILHLTNDPNINPVMPVDDDTVAAAERIVRDFILPHALEFYGIGVNEQERLRRLASFILTSGKTRIVASDLTTNVWDMRGLTLKEVNDRMSPLEAGGWVEPEIRVSFNNKAWRVLPAVAAKFAARQRVEAERKAAIVEMIAKNAD